MMMKTRKEKKQKIENRKPLVALVRHAWDTVDLFYPWALGRPCTTCLGYGKALGRPCTTCLGYSGPILSLGPWSPLYDMPGIQWTYSIPGPLVALVRHAWDTVDLFYPQALGRPCTTCLGHSGPILSLGPWSPLYDMPGIQWTYYIPGPLVALVRHAWDTVDLLYPQAHTGRAEVKECCHDDIDTCVPRDGMALTYRRL